MKDIIDLGNKVFDRLVEEYGESQESRMLFLYGITTSTKWSIIGSDKWVLIHADGVMTNFDDGRLADLSEQWRSIRDEQSKVAVANRLKTLREEYEKPSPKDGETFNFWSDSGSFREIRL